MSRRVARPYAAALYSVMAKRDVTALREVQRQLEGVVALFEHNEKLLRVFEVPSVTPAKKRELLKAVGAALALRVEAQRLLAALDQHYRLRFLPEVVAAFRDLIDEREGMVRGRVELPAAASAKQLEAMGTALEGVVGARVELEGVVRPELLAGFVVRLGSRVYDGSLRTQLDRFAAASQER